MWTSDQWIIDKLKEVGYNTAKAVLKVDRDTLIARTDLEEDTIDDVINVLKSEFN